MRDDGGELDTETTETSVLEPGTRVSILNPFVPSWSDGFEIAAYTSDGYVVRRLIDGHVLPRPFGTADVRPVGPSPPRPWW